MHEDALVRQVLDTPVAEGTVQLDADTFLSPGAAEAALRAAGAGIAAVDAVMSGKARRVFCAVRPPGHHATRDTAMGFCFFDSIAVAAAHALDVHGLERVAIVDFDVHDVGDYRVDGQSRVLEPGMVFTIEPGLDVDANDTTVDAKWRGIGIRTEDDVLVTKDGARMLTAALARSADEIEAFMAR